jgi:trk system potassium uptake protein
MKQSVLVIGLGRFGSELARELMRLGHEVMAVDRDEREVNDLAPDVTHALQLDATDVEGLKAIGAADFEHAVVAISGDPEPSIFATMALKQLGVPNVISKAGTALHGAILERVGADRVVFPEREMGQRVAHVFAFRAVVDYLDLGPRFGIMTFQPPEAYEGRALRELDLERHKLTPIAIRRGDHVIVGPGADERIEASDLVIVIGLDEGLEKLGS